MSDMSNKDKKDKSSDKRDMLLSKLSKKKIKVIGLTGVMGAGKSSVSKILKEMKIPILDCDVINAKLMEPKQFGYEQIKAKFGSSILDNKGFINKAKLSDLIFHDVSLKKQLEDIQHPLIKDYIVSHIKDSESRLLVVEVPLLFELHWQDYFDEVWVVSCDESLLLKRLKQFRNIDEAEAKLRLSHQMPQTEKIELADFVIQNDGNIEDLRNCVVQKLKREVYEK